LPPPDKNKLGAIKGAMVCCFLIEEVEEALAGGHQADLCAGHQFNSKLKMQNSKSGLTRENTENAKDSSATRRGD
jgi:hypothetical protein